MSSELLALASEALRWIDARQIAGLEAELYLSRSEERSIERRDGKPDEISQASADGAGLRILLGGRMGFSSAGGLSLAAIQGLFERILTELPHLGPDALRAFPKKGDSPLADPKLSETLWDESLFTESWDAIVPRLEKLERRVREADARISSVLRSGYSESRGEVVVANSSGLLAWERGGSASVGASAMASDGGEIQVGSAFDSQRVKSRLDFDRVAREAAERTVALLGAAKMPGGRRAVVFDPWVSGEFLELIAQLLCADQVQRGKSLLSGKLGARVGSELATFIDDPRRPGGLASSLYDDEGCPTIRKVAIEGGVVKEFFYDTYTAARDRVKSNASAGRGSYKGLPGPGCSNFYLAPGKTSRDALIGSTADGILILEVMGMHMADPISGEFSVGVSGLAIRDGKLGRSVKNAMISGNLLELLAGIDAVADDLVFHGSLGAPTFRVAALAMA